MFGQAAQVAEPFQWSDRCGANDSNAVSGRVEVGALVVLVGEQAGVPSGRADADVGGECCAAQLCGGGGVT